MGPFGEGIKQRARSVEESAGGLTGRREVEEGKGFVEATSASGGCGGRDAQIGGYCETRR